MINYNNNKMVSWQILSDCDIIRLTSSSFDTNQGYDVLTIAGQEYSGSDIIDQIINGSSFVVTYSSNKTSDENTTGFTLHWSCFTGHIEWQNGI